MQFEDVIARCSESTGDLFEKFLGPMNWSTLLSCPICVQGVDIEHQTSPHPPPPEDMLRKSEAPLGVSTVGIAKPVDN